MRVIVAFLLAAALQLPVAPGPVSVVLREKTPLQVSDLQYLGGYPLTASTGVIGGQDYSLAEGFALREVNGELHSFFGGHRVIEQRVPTQLSANPTAASAAPILKVWGTVPNPQPFTGPIKTFGLYWDDATQLLWHAQGHEYNTMAPLQPTIGASRLDASTTTVTTLGIWGLTNRSAKFLYGGLTAIPDWFAARYTHGRRLGAGFGFYFSIANTGPISMGPALSAFDPAVMLAAPTKSSIAYTSLVGYPFSANCNAPRVHRDPDYVDDYDHCAPKNGVGTWIWNDHSGHCAWIDTPGTSGLLCAPTLGNGRGWYYNSTLNSERGSHAWMIYDPADLVKVAQGAPESSIQPSFTVVRYPGVTYPLAGWAGLSTVRVIGMATYRDRLYIALMRGWKFAPVVLVYQVSA